MSLNVLKCQQVVPKENAQKATNKISTQIFKKKLKS